MAKTREARAAGQLEPVGELLRSLLRRLGLEHRLEEQRVIEAWPTIVGPAVAEQARAVAIREGVLFVDVANNVWMQELGLLRDSIAERLNAHLGAPLVHKIVLSIERPPLQEGSAAPWQREDEESHDD
jgi:predicted nucleic acid-binding Zn ribbon protein